MIYLLRALSHLVAFVLLTVLAVAGLAVALFSIGSGSEGLSLPSLANLLRLTTVEGAVGTFLGGLEGGSLRNETLLFGAVAVLAALLLLIGALRRPAEGVMVLSKERAGRIAARRRPLGQAVAALASRARGVAATKVRIKPKRRRLGGRIEVTAMHSRRTDPKELGAGVSESLRSLSGDSRSLKVRIRLHTGEGGQKAHSYHVEVPVHGRPSEPSQQRQLSASLGRLDPEDRAVLELSKRRGMSDRQIADVLHSTPQAVTRRRLDAVDQIAVWTGAANASTDDRRALDRDLDRLLSPGGAPVADTAE